MKNVKKNTNNEIKIDLAKKTQKKVIFPTKNHLHTKNKNFIKMHFKLANSKSATHTQCKKV